MYLLNSIYYWAADGCPDAMPVGVIAVNLGQNEAVITDEDLSDWSKACSQIGLFDDTAWQLSFTEEDVDLIRKIDDTYVYYVRIRQIVPDWQWTLIRTQPGLRIVEHDYEKALKAMECADEDDTEEGIELGG